MRTMMMTTMRTEEGAEETLQGEKKGANALFSFRKTTLNASFSDTDNNAIPTTTAATFSLQTFSLLR
jgi:hypothetical protein